MAIVKDLAQVLRLHEQGNSSLVAVMLGRRLGQFRVHIKGARRWPKKGFEGGFDLLARGEMLVYPRGDDALWVFKEWDERARPRLGRSLGRLRAASFLCELTEALTRHTAGVVPEKEAVRRDAETQGREGEAATLYDLLAESADGLAAGADAATAGLLLLSFAVRALACEGLLGELHVCSACGRDVTRSPRTAGQASSGTLKPVWLTHEGARCGECVAEASRRDAETQRNNRAQGSGFRVQSVAEERGAWLGLEAYRVLLHLSVSTRPVSVSAAAAQQLGRAVVVLVHGALEHDLRTLTAAARMVAVAGRKTGS
jgi:recombinational DNA repair protein (RecF pathway)